MAKSPAPGVPLHAPSRASVARRQRFTGKLPLARLPRLAEMLSNAEGELQVDLQAQTDASGAPQLSGTVNGDVELVCQRCLRPFVRTLSVAVDLRLVETEEDEQRLMHECEPYQVVDDRLPLHDLIEDEVLLALPLSPRCGRPDCQPTSG